MTDEELAKEWQASPHWGGWRKGMVDDSGSVRGDQYSDGTAEWGGYQEGCSPWPLCPDLTHPGTRAFLLEDVRRAWEDEGAMSGKGVEDEWSCYYLDGRGIHGAGEGPTEQAALIAALRAAPEPDVS